ncbi:MAG: hypothetical protein V1892_00650 [bacterium]
MKLLNNSTIEIAASRLGGTRNDKMINSMTERHQKILKEIVRSYVRSAQPIGSEFLIRKLGGNLSSATVRNEMAKLEDGGYIYQPHTSAGRIPTEKGYQFYLDNFLSEKDLSAEFEKSIRRIESAKNKEEVYKNVAKSAAQLSGQTIVISFSKNNTYYTGVFNLFSQPEFSEFDLVRNFSRMIDNLDEIIAKLYNQLGSQIEISIGHTNPFSPYLASILTMANNKTLLGLIGPMRMDYERNLALVKCFKNYVEK